jgi:hypothetical protein
MGAWLSQLVEQAVAGSLPPSEPSVIERFETIERRLDKIERAIQAERAEPSKRAAKRPEHTFSS